MIKVEVYRNLHKNCYSIKDCKTGRVISHSKNVTIKWPRFVVQPAGKERVRRERKKNVHAFVRGFLASSFDANTKSDIKVTYNPYKNDSFVCASTGNPIDVAEFAYLTDKGVFINE